MFSRLFSGVVGFFSPDLALEFGSAYSRALLLGKSEPLMEPTLVVTRRTLGGKSVPMAVGRDAYALLGRTPRDMDVVRPFWEGRVRHEGMMKMFISHLFQMATSGHPFLNPRVALCVPMGMDRRQIASWKQTLEQLGSREVWVIPAPLAAAVGMEIPMDSGEGSLMIDFGAASSEISLIRQGRLSAHQRIPIGGDHLTRALIRGVLEMKGLNIGYATAEEIKKSLLNAPGTSIMLRGQDAATGYPRTSMMNLEELSQAVSQPWEELLRQLMFHLEQLREDETRPIGAHGALLMGGGAVIPLLAESLQEVTSMPMIMAEEPRIPIVKGGCLLLQERERMEALLHHHRRGG